MADRGRPGSRQIMINVTEKAAEALKKMLGEEKSKNAMVRLYVAGVG